MSQNGKGDTYRPTDHEAFISGWDRVFKKHETQLTCGCIESRDSEGFLFYVTPCKEHNQHEDYEPED